MFDEIASHSSEEFYSVIPDGYKPGKTKYLVVTGSVISGIGKGTFTSALGKCLINRKLRVVPIKMEAYLNVDAGTLNPYRHGEVFVLDDGTETDMDLGSYERFLDLTVNKDSFVTSGRIYQSIIQKEREGKYLGRDVQFVPHVTGEVKNVLRNLAVKSKADMLLIEVGGTVGDYENLHIMEAMRQLRYEEGAENVCLVNLTYILEPSSVGEFKTKAAQLGIKKMLELGLQPDVVICRSEHPITQKVTEKISLNCNVPMNRVFGMHNVDNIYSLPLFLRNLGVDTAILVHFGWDQKFKLDGQQKALEQWTKANVVEKPVKAVTVGIAGKYTGLFDSYISILKALEHCAAVTQSKVNVKWIETTDLEKGKRSVEEAMAGVDGLIVPGGFGSRGVEGKISCIGYARTHGIPYLGLCYGMQLATIEFARNACGLKDANTTEVNPRTPHPVICILPEQEDIEGLGGTMRLGGYDVLVEKGTLAYKLYGAAKIRERFRHRFNVNTQYIDQLTAKGLVFSGRAPQKRIMQIMELPVHKFFVGTQFHPEFTSRPLKPNPLFLGFVKACLQ